jgi:class 3 adenylate cyclase
VTQRPATAYAWHGDTALAYQVFGDGPVDLVYLQGWASHVELNWESPSLARFLRGLGRMARVIHTDRRGWGCSDRFSPGDVAPLEVQADDLAVVMDAAGSRRAIVFGSWETAPTALLFAASHPDRCAGLVLVDPYVTFVATAETPWMLTEAGWEEQLARASSDWGDRAWARGLIGEIDEWEIEWFGPWMRSAIAPGALIAEYREFYRVDVRAVLPSIRVPVLVTGHRDVESFRENARFAAERIPGAQLLELADDTGEQFHWYRRAPALLDEIGRLVDAVRVEQTSLDRVLATVLFTDIVGSTALATELGDTRWKDLVARHDTISHAEVARHRGAVIRGTGDGLLATFDGPARAVRCALAIMDGVRPLRLEIRAGCHTGEIELMGEDVAGVAVHIGARVGSLAGPGEVWASSTVKDLTAGSGLAFEDRGEHVLKGVPDRWRLYRVRDGQATS